MDRRSALLVVDMQIDFCPGGSLAVPGGDAIIPVINRYIELFRSRGLPVIATRDWHHPVTRHFREFGGLWPPHCVQGSAGALFHPELRLPGDVVVVSKGMDPARDDYSSFRATLETGLTLREHLENAGVTKLYLCGLATDYCVRDTSLDALKAGLGVTVLQDAVRGVDLEAGDSARALEEITRMGGKLADLAAIEKESD
jgi:nicotinamidase/pyrazinamidase